MDEPLMIPMFNSHSLAPAQNRGQVENWVRHVEDWLSSPDPPASDCRPPETCFANAAPLSPDADDALVAVARAKAPATAVPRPNREIILRAELVTSGVTSDRNTVEPQIAARDLACKVATDQSVHRRCDLIIALA